MPKPFPLEFRRDVVVTGCSSYPAEAAAAGSLPGSSAAGQLRTHAWIPCHPGDHSPAGERSPFAGAPPPGSIVIARSPGREIANEGAIMKTNQPARARLRRASATAGIAAAVALAGAAAAAAATTAPSPASAQVLRAGQTGSRTQIPWRSVGAGWTLATDTTAAPFAGLAHPDRRAHV